MLARVKRHLSTIGPVSRGRSRDRTSQVSWCRTTLVGCRWRGHRPARPILGRGLATCLPGVAKRPAAGSELTTDAQFRAQNFPRRPMNAADAARLVTRQRYAMAYRSGTGSPSGWTQPGAIFQLSFERWPTPRVRPFRFVALLRGPSSQPDPGRMSTAARFLAGGGGNVCSRPDGLIGPFTVRRSLSVLGWKRPVICRPRDR